MDVEADDDAQKDEAAAAMGQQDGADSESFQVIGSDEVAGVPPEDDEEMGGGPGAAGDDGVDE